MDTNKNDVSITGSLVETRQLEVEGSTLGMQGAVTGDEIRAPEGTHQFWTAFSKPVRILATPAQMQEALIDAEQQAKLEEVSGGDWWRRKAEKFREGT